MMSASSGETLAVQRDESVAGLLGLLRPGRHERRYPASGAHGWRWTCFRSPRALPDRRQRTHIEPRSAEAVRLAFKSWKRRARTRERSGPLRGRKLDEKARAAIEVVGLGGREVDAAPVARDEVCGDRQAEPGPCLAGRLLERLEDPVLLSGGKPGPVSLISISATPSVRIAAKRIAFGRSAGRALGRQRLQRRCGSNSRARAVYGPDRRRPRSAAGCRHGSRSPSPARRRAASTTFCTILFRSNSGVRAAARSRRRRSGSPGRTGSRDRASRRASARAAGPAGRGSSRGDPR